MPCKNTGTIPKLWAADLVVALTHYGKEGDRMILEQHDFVDLVVGGHNHRVYNEKVAGRYMVQSGANLEVLTKLSLTVKMGKSLNTNHEIIELNEVVATDETLEQVNC